MKTQGKFRKRPVIIDAIQYDGTNFWKVLTWIQEVSTADVTTGVVSMDMGSSVLTIDTKEGPMKAPPGWYIIRGVKGEFYSCEPEIFELTYEEVEDE